MNEHRVNYDEIAATCDARYASGVAEDQHDIAAALRDLVRSDVSNRILEVGCGTGFWLNVFGSGHEVYVLDLSAVMLAQARQRHAQPDDAGACAKSCHATSGDEYRSAERDHQAQV